MEPSSCPGCRERDARIAALEARLSELEGRLNDLTKPPLPPRPSSSQPAAPPKKPSGKKPGGQTGHPPHLKVLLPPERVQKTIALVPSACACCQRPLPQEAGPQDPAPLRHQVVELPELTAQVTEYQGQARTCAGCGQVTWAAIPKDLRAHSVGPRLSAALAYLAGAHGVSKRGLEEISEALFQAPIALGTVANLQEEMSAALAPSHQEAVAALRAAPVKNIDETGWKQQGRKRWLWAAATSKVAVFLIDSFRNASVLTKLFGQTFTGIFTSDRWRAYDHLPLMQRQVCWAHLKRNWEAMAERGGKAQVLARACLEVHRRVFEQWHLFRGGGLSRQQLDEQLAPRMLELLAVLQAGLRCRDRKTRRFCQRLLAVYPALWTFVVEEGVEPTNNHAERVQRRAVLWRRRSFGCQSAAGCRFVQRILTVVQSLRLQARSVLQFLYQALTAHRSGLQGPQLVLEG
jgi:transposase